MRTQSSLTRFLAFQFQVTTTGECNWTPSRRDYECDIGGQIDKLEGKDARVETTVQQLSNDTHFQTHQRSN